MTSKKATQQNHTKKINWEEIHQKINASEHFLAINLDSDLLAQKNILKKRADSLAKESSHHTQTQEKIDVLAFQIETERYAVEVNYIDKVYLLKDLTPLPGVASYLIGIINVRGNIVPVIDFKQIFELHIDTNIKDQKVVVVSALEATFGLLADEVLGLESILVNSIQNDLPTFNGIRLEYLKGVTDKQLVILDPLKIATHKSIIINDQYQV